MTVAEITLPELLTAREALIARIRLLMDANARQFLKSFHKLEPDWSILGFEGIEKLPSVQWKLENLRRLQSQNPKKYTELLKMLDDMLELTGVIMMDEEIVHALALKVSFTPSSGAPMTSERQGAPLRAGPALPPLTKTAST